MKKACLIIFTIIGTFYCHISKAQCTGRKGPNILGDRGTFSSPFITVNQAASACTYSATNTFNPAGNIGNGFGVCSGIGMTLPCSDYKYTAEILGLFPDFTYSIIKNIGDNNGGNCIKGDWRGKDHTGDGGYFMAVNGATAIGNSPVFYQVKNIPVCVGATYELSAFVLNLLPKTNGNAKPGTEPNISFKINGNIVVSTGPVAYSNTPTWVKVTGSFTAATPLVDLQVISTASVLIGNDFGLDDMSINICIPESAFNGPLSASICNGTGITGDAIISGIIQGSSSYDWQISTDGGTSFAVADPSSVTQTGIYRLIVSNSCGLPDTATVNVSIKPRPILASDKNVTTCSGNMVDLTKQFNSDTLNNVWTLGGNIVSTPAAVNLSGLYQLIASNNAGCADTALVDVIVNPKPNFGPDQNFTTCAGNGIDLTKFYSTTGLASSWTTGNIPVVNPGAITVGGMFEVIGVNSFSCADTAKVTVVIYPNPTVKTVNPGAVCFPSTVDLTLAAVTSGSTHGLNFTYWQNADASVSSPNPATAGNGLYFIKGTDQNGCFNIQPVTVIVYQLPVVSAGRDTTICDQTFAVLNGGVSNLSGSTVNYAWSPATAVDKVNSPTTIVRPIASTTYMLTATVKYDRCSLSGFNTVRVNVQPPVPAFAGNDTNAIEGVPHQLKATGGVSYLWFPGSSLDNPAIANPLAIFQKDTRLTVRVTDFAGCVATDTIFITVFDNIKYNLPTAFSPNGDGLNDIFRPHPVGITATDFFRIYNRFGNLMFESIKSLKGWDGNLNGRDQPVGNYVWVIKGMGKDGKVVQMKGNVVLVR
ncbi:MAG: domain containing protein [Ferruginibacter sp.]|nr:domain containing protein [Ferruginibacter sp.]